MLTKETFEDRHGILGTSIAERLTADEVTTGEVGDREPIAIATIGKHELALVIGAPEIIRLGRDRQCRPPRFCTVWIGCD